MIIKKTDFIAGIYQKQMGKNRKMTIREYGKSYTYNVRSRNVRDVTHLLIMNYAPTTEQTQNKQLSFSTL
jgi:hypothetical protein